MMLAFGIGFEFPILLDLHADGGHRRAARACAHVPALRHRGHLRALVAVITPSGDPISMLMLSVPMVHLLRGRDPHRPDPGAARSAPPRPDGAGAARLRLRARPVPAAGDRRPRRRAVGAGGRPHRERARRWWPSTPWPRPSPRAQGLLHGADQGAVEPEVHRPRSAATASSGSGLLTGDNAINGDAPVVVMTTEVLRNMIYAGSPAAARPALRGARRGALPPGRLPRPGVGGGDDPPAAGRGARVPVGHRVERRGAGRLDHAPCAGPPRR